jgi:uncharacterized membrane protein
MIDKRGRFRKPKDRFGRCPAPATAKALAAHRVAAPSRAVGVTMMMLSGRLLLAIGILALGIVGLVTGDFVSRWEPVAAGLPAHRALAMISGGLLVALGAGLLAPRTRRVAALALGLLMVAWVVVLHAPLVAAKPEEVVRWIYPGEVASIGCGALLLWSSSRRALLTARIVYGLSLIAFGVSHFAYLQVVAPTVPAYVPFHIQVVELTGAAHIAAGLALLAGRLSRLAAVLEAAMMTGFELLVNVPAAVGAPTTKGPWLALTAEGALIGAAWIIAAALWDPPRTA